MKEIVYSQRPPSFQAFHKAYRDGLATPSDVTETYLARISRIPCQWGPIFSKVTTARARAEAEQSTRRFKVGSTYGPCDGIPVVWKDVFGVAGAPSTIGTKFLHSAPALKDAGAVAALTEAGAICLGKTHCSELSFSVLGENEVLGTPSHPCSSGAPRLPGGSSSGAAVAVARGLAPASIGADSGGSVRLPAAWCGLTGFVPTRKIIRKDGMVPFSPSLDSVGFITNCVNDAQLLLGTFLEKPFNLQITNDAPVLLIPTLRSIATLSDEVNDQFVRTVAILRQAGFIVENSDYSIIGDVHRLQSEYGSLAMMEGAELWSRTVADARGHASDRLRRSFNEFKDKSSSSKEKLLQGISHLTASFCDGMEHNSYLLFPTSPITSPDESAVMGSQQKYAQVYADANAFLWPFNILDAPSISLPAGTTKTGLPIGIAIAAPQYRDIPLLGVAEEIENVIAAYSSQSVTQ